jgi:hypothetical protein
MYTIILLKAAILPPSLNIHSFHSSKEVEGNCQTDWKPNWLQSRNEHNNSWNHTETAR